MKKVAILILFASVLCIGLLTSCGGDDETKELEIILDGESISLSDASLYFTSQGTTFAGNARSAGNPSTHTYRDYYLSDGTWNGEGFSGASFYFNIQLAVPIDDDFEPGNYPSDTGWSGFEGMKISWLGFENADYGFISVDDSLEDILTVSGGFDDGDTMTLSFEGPVDGNVTEVELYFKGEVSDVRPM